ncbi:hypothetical protein [Methylobacterium sp. WSM2598]|uniref:hypothetical protein n=1 Tax=Methylobacterium sp. WSM2598 TaxID=398261 RepID=UPI0012F6A787|nr:hypothetical protein [Methylobacterium sp. WSM2598]
MGSTSDHLPAEIVLRLLSIVEQDDAIVIGGQAISIWAEHYRPHIPDLFSRGPLTSKDLDFFRNEAAVKRLVSELNAKARKATIDDFTPSAASVVAVLMDRSIVIDFMNQVAGVDRQQLVKRRVRLTGRDWATDRQITIPVMHPMDCVWSRFGNINNIPRLDEHSSVQARASLLILSRFIMDAIELGKLQHAQDLLMELCHLIRNLHQGKHTHMDPRVKQYPEDVIKVFKDYEIFDARWREKTLHTELSRVVNSMNKLEKHLITRREAMEARKAAVAAAGSV